MKKIVLILCMLLIFIADLNAEQQYGFQDISFGSSWKAVYEKVQQIKQQYDEEAFKNRSDHLKHYDFTEWKYVFVGEGIQVITSKEDKYIYLSNYKFKLGDLGVNIMFYFDQNDQFYSFAFKTKPLSANFLKTQVYQDGAYITDVFKAKYGKPEKCFKNPSILSLQHGKLKYLCKWKHKELKIYTGIGEDNMRYYSGGVVTSKAMEQAFKKFQQQKTKTDTSKASESF